jgi:hypothetical protein
MPILVIEISPTEEEKILSLEEGHFADFKGIAISPAKLTKTIAAFSNAEGGEAYVGISQSSARTNFWAGFQNIEAANGHIQAFERPSVPSNVTLSPIPRRCPWNSVLRAEFHAADVPFVLKRVTHSPRLQSPDA